MFRLHDLISGRNTFSFHSGRETFLKATETASASEVFIDDTLLVKSAGESLVAEDSAAEEAFTSLQKTRSIKENVWHLRCMRQRHSVFLYSYPRILHRVQQVDRLKIGVNLSKIGVALTQIHMFS